MLFPCALEERELDWQTSIYFHLNKRKKCFWINFTTESVSIQNDYELARISFESLTQSRLRRRNENLMYKGKKN